MDARDQAIALWRAGVAAVDGYAATAAALEGAAPDRIIAVGKAAGAMARAALARWGDVPALVVTKDGHGGGLPDRVQLIEAAHPVPDARSLAAGRALRQDVESMAPGSSLLLLVSGGASALAEDPVEGATLEDLAALNRRLLAAGLDIVAMNARRRGMSRIKGGGLLARFRGARVRVLAISDVPGDDLNVIGSGIGAAPEAAGFDFAARIVASNAIARAACGATAQRAGLNLLENQEALHDDLDVLAARWGPRLRNMGTGVMVLGGEPTVVLPENPGRGGRNQALALALAQQIAGVDGLHVVVGGTDGSDGPTDAAGAIVDGTTWGPGANEALARADSGTWLDRRGALLVTGPTGTNVMDLLVAVRA
jgi:glycerate 2-kinase